MLWIFLGRSPQSFDLISVVLQRTAMVTRSARTSLHLRPSLWISLSCNLSLLLMIMPCHAMHGHSTERQGQVRTIYPRYQRVVNVPPSLCPLRSANPDKEVLVRETSILSGQKVIQNVYTGRRVIKMCAQGPFMISSRNLRTTMDAKEGINRQMGIKYAHNLRGQ